MYTEQDWPDLSKITYAYAKSKILAEKAAWDFVEEKKRNGEMCFELSVINPSFVMGKRCFFFALTNLTAIVSVSLLTILKSS